MRYLTFTQLRAKLGWRARSSIYIDVEAGRLPPPIKLGGRLYWWEAGVDERLRNTAPQIGNDDGRA
jgi:predicted DNA-binding transcriptional regulator AlpA